MADYNTSLNEPVATSSDNNSTVNNNNLLEMETQIPYPDSDSIYCAATQLPMESNSSPFHSMDTQLPVPNLFIEHKISEKHHTELHLEANKENDKSLYDAETQMPIEYENGNKANITDGEGAETQLPNLENINLPNECKQNDNEVFTAATQLPDSEKDSIFTAPTQLPTFENAVTQLPTIVKQSLPAESRAKTKDNFGDCDKSDDQILFDELDDPFLVEEFNSQPLLRQENSPEEENVIIPLSQASHEIEDDVINPNPLALKRFNRIESDSTDCDDLDILQTQKSPAPIDDDLTDCEDDIEMEPNKLKIPEPKTPNFEDIATQSVVKSVPQKSSISSFVDFTTHVIEEGIKLNNEIPKSVLESSDEMIEHKNLVLNSEMATQVISDDMKTKYDKTHKLANKTFKGTTFEDMATQVIPEYKETDFEDLATQVIDEIPPENVNCSNTANDQYSEEIIHSFKVPYSTPLKTKRKDTPKSSENNFKLPKSPIKIVNLANDEQYYAATQELYDDLCSQGESSLEFVGLQPTNMVDNSLLKEKQIEIINLDDEIVPSSVTDYKRTNRVQHIENEITPKRKYIATDKSSESSDGDEKVDKYISSLSNKMLREVIGVDMDVANIKRVPSDHSDVEVTPTKVRPFKFIETELPSSQEIKTSITMVSKNLELESSCDSEPESNSTPILYRKKMKVSKHAKVDLMKKIERLALPTRVITRVRKPTSKIQDRDEETKKLSKNILKMKILPEFDEVNKEIISGSICRLKTKTDNKDVTTNLTRPAEVKKENKTRKNVAANKKKEDICGTHENEKTANRSKVKRKTVKNNEDKKINKAKNDSEIPTEQKRKSTHSTKQTKKRDSRTSSMENYLIRKSRHIEIGTAEESVLSSSSDNAKTALCPETRSTRRKQQEYKISKNSNDSTKELKMKRGRPKNTDDRSLSSSDKIDKKTEKVDISEQTDIRRITRKRIVKVIETKQNDRNSKSKLSKDQSTVYNISSESNVESPRPLKRSAGGNDAPSPKRTRSSISTILNSNMSMATSNRSSLGSKAVRRVRTHYVLFTAFPYEKVKTKLETLGKLKMF